MKVWIVMHESFVLVIGGIFFWCLLKRSCLWNTFHDFTRGQVDSDKILIKFILEIILEGMYIFFLSAIIHNKNMKTILEEEW